MEQTLTVVSTFILALAVLAGGIWHVARIEIRMARLNTLVELLVARSGLHLSGGHE